MFITCIASTLSKLGQENWLLGIAAPFLSPPRCCFRITSFWCQRAKYDNRKRGKSSRKTALKTSEYAKSKSSITKFELVVSVFGKHLLESDSANYYKNLSNQLLCFLKYREVSNSDASSILHFDATKSRQQEQFNRSH